MATSSIPFHPSPLVPYGTDTQTPTPFHPQTQSPSSLSPPTSSSSSASAANTKEKEEKDKILLPRGRGRTRVRLNTIGGTVFDLTDEFDDARVGVEGSRSGSRSGRSSIDGGGSLGEGREKEKEKENGNGIGIGSLVSEEGNVNSRSILRNMDGTNVESGSVDPSSTTDGLNGYPPRSLDTKTSSSANQYDGTLHPSLPPDSLSPLAASSAPMQSQAPHSQSQKPIPQTSLPSSEKPEKRIEDSPTKENKSRKSLKEKLNEGWKGFLGLDLVKWIWPKLSNFEEMKPVIRCSVAAWIGLLMLLIYDVEATLGQAAFFVLIVAFISPPSLPLIQYAEQTIFLFLFVSIAWAWVVLAVFLAELARTNGVNSEQLAIAQVKYAGLESTNPTAYARDIIFDGTYLQAGPSVICAAFLAIGTAFFAWIKITTAPAPWTFACVFACIVQDVALTTVQLFPYPYYTSGLLFILPMAVQAAISTLAAILIFPESANASFTKKLIGVLTPLDTAYEDMLKLFLDVKAKGIEPHSSDEGQEDRLTLFVWAARAGKVKEKITSSGVGLGPAKAQSSYLAREPSYGRLSGADLKELFGLIQTLQLRSGGVTFFFDVVDQAVNKSQLDTAVFKVAQAHEYAQASRAPTPAASRDPSPTREAHATGQQSPSPLAGLEGSRRGSGELQADHDSDHNDYDALVIKRKHEGRPTAAMHLLHMTSASRFFHLRKRNESSSDHHSSRLSLFDHFKKSNTPVGLYESVRFMNLERSLPSNPQHISTQMTLLAESATPLLTEISACVAQSKLWFQDVNHHRSLRRYLFPKMCKPLRSPEAAERLTRDTGNLRIALAEFRDARRLVVIEPYLHLLDPTHPPTDGIDYSKLEHRGLYWDFLASYHLMEFAETLLELLDKIAELDRTNPQNRIWYPSFSFTWKGFNGGSHNSGPEADDMHDEVDPEGALPEAHLTLAATRGRDPDHEPWSSPALNSLRFLSRIPQAFTTTGALFALKAGVLTVLVAMPAYFPDTAGFFYHNRGLWVIVMAQLTLALFSGDTISAWLIRIQASFFGVVLGMVLWYIAEGNSHTEPYGLGAVCAVAFVPLMLIRVHAPLPPLTSILFTVSTVLVLGYSWGNGTLVQLTAASWGFSVAWRRLVCVFIGVTAAFIWALLPPTSPGKVAIRHSYARTISQLGTITCDIVSQGLSHDFDRGVNQIPVRDNILAIRRKLVKLAVRQNTIIYEISTKGRWPAERYQALHAILVDWTSLSSQLHHVLRQLPTAWRRAVLERSRLSDPKFLGEVNAVFSMVSSALETGNPLPQVTVGPLIEKLYIDNYYGLEITHDSHLGLPQHVSAELLRSENYLKYALAITVTFSIIRRLDRLLLVCKTICGEAYHIDIDLEDNYPLLRRNGYLEFGHHDEDQ